MFNVGDAVVFLGRGVEVGRYHPDYQQLFGQTGFVSSVGPGSLVTATFPGFSYLDVASVPRSDFVVFADEIQKVVDPA